MASEEIKLIGSFQDNITPQLKKLQRELDAVTRSFTKLGRRIRPVTREMGKLAVSTRSVAENLQQQRNSLEASTRAMRSYTTASRKAAAQQHKFRAAQSPSSARARGGGAVPVGGGGGGKGGMMIGGLAAGGSAFGATAGAQMQMLVNQGIMMGFNYGRDIIMGVFQKFGQAVGERIEDEMSDIQSAGGMFALDKKQDEGARLFNNFTQARNMQELLNRELAKSAASLPGATSDYVQSAKQLTDTVFGTFAKDKDAFAKLAVSLGGKEGGTETEDITKVLSRFTEQSVLLSQGAGKGGMPLGMLLEQLISQEQVNVKGLKRRYAQLRKNPLLANMLEDAEDAINQSGAMTADRFAAVMGALDNALPEEVINSMRRSVSGVTESVRSAFLDPEVGLLGLGRPLKDTVSSINAFGQYIDAEGKVVQSAAEAAQENTTVFKMLRDILAGFGGAIGEIAQILPSVFDPLSGLAQALKGLREKAVVFQQQFTAMANSFKEMGLDNAGARGAIMSFSKMMKDSGMIDEKEYRANLAQMSKKEANFAAVVPQLFQQILKSDFAEEVGRTIGDAIGQMLSTLAGLMSGAVTEFGESGFAKGLAQGWKKAGGTNAIKTIFSTIFDVMGKLLLTAITTFPMESAIVALIAALPAVLAGIGAALPSLLATFGPPIVTAIGAWISGWLLPTIAGWLGAVGPAVAGIGTALAGLGSAIGAAASAALAFAAPILAIVGAITGVIALVRHGEFIIGSTIEALNIFGQTLKLTAGQLTEGLGKLISAIGGFVQTLPGMKYAGRVIQDGGIGMENAGVRMQNEATESIKASMAKIAANTEASLARTNADFAKIADVIGIGSDKEVAAAEKTAAAALDNANATKSGVDLVTTAAQATTTAVIATNAAVNATTSAVNGTTAAVQALGAIFQNVASNISSAVGQMAQAASRPVTVNVTGGAAASSYAGDTKTTMGLGSAIASEMKHKPPGSHLVIANSSETVIPAAKGFTPRGSMSSPMGAMGSGQGDVRVGDITVNVSGANDATAIAEQVAQEIVYAIQKSTYNELYTS